MRLNGTSMAKRGFGAPGRGWLLGRVGRCWGEWALLGRVGRNRGEWALLGRVGRYWVSGSLRDLRRWRMRGSVPWSGRR